MTPEMLQKTLSVNIKLARKKCAISQEKLAEQAGLSVQMINNIEGSRRWPSEKTLVKIANALNVEVFALFMPQTEDNNILKTLKRNIASELKIVLENALDCFVSK